MGRDNRKKPDGPVARPSSKRYKGETTLRPTFMGFETAKSSIFSNQKALDIVGNNLANIDTNGYTRQRVETAALAPSSYTSRVCSSRIGLTGQGVEAVGVSQMRDSFLDKRFRDEYSVTGYHGKAADILQDIQSALGDGSDITSTSDLLSGIQRIWESIADFRKEPTADTQANLIMSAFRNVTQILQQLDTKLNGVTQQQTYDMGLDVDRVNDIAEQIASLNQKISSDSTVLTDPNNEHYRPNELYDQRNLLLDELSGYGNVSVTEMANGMVNVTMGGKPIVTGLENDSLVLTQNQDKTVNLKWRSSGEDVRLTGGTLEACIEFINGRGNNIQSNTETPQQGIPYYRDRLDTFAKELAKLANGTIPEKVDNNGNAVPYDANNNPMIDADGNPTYKIVEEDIYDDQDPTRLLVRKGSYVDINDTTKVLYAKQADGTFMGPSGTKEVNVTYSAALYCAEGCGGNLHTAMESNDSITIDGQTFTCPADFDPTDSIHQQMEKIATAYNAATPPHDFKLTYDTSPGDHERFIFEATNKSTLDADGNPIAPPAPPSISISYANATVANHPIDPNIAITTPDELNVPTDVLQTVAGPEIKYKTLLSSGSTTNDETEVTAANISLSKAWNDGGAGYFISNKNMDASQFAQQLAVALTEQDHTFSSYGEKFNGTYEEYVRDFVEKLGTDINYQEGRQEATAKVADDFIARRDEISGVSRDEETANMLMYQKSYEAAARMMTTLDDLLDVVINRMGRVGL